MSATSACVRSSLPRWRCETTTSSSKPACRPLNAKAKSASCSCCRMESRSISGKSFSIRASPAGPSDSNVTFARWGRNISEWSIVPIEGELSAENNERDFEVNVTRSDIKILLADEFPSWEYRYLTQLFRRDAKVQCDELLFRPRMIATGRREESKSFPDHGRRMGPIRRGDARRRSQRTFAGRRSGIAGRRICSIEAGRW